MNQSNLQTAEEILDSHYESGMHWKSVNRAKVLAAMESYAYQSLLQQPVNDNELFNFLIGTDKPFLIDATRDIIQQYIKKELSLSKLVETLNEAAYNWHKSKPVSATPQPTGGL